MRVIETVRTSQCPRCGKPATRCRCDLKKSIRQRTKCVYSYNLPKVAETEKMSSNEGPSPESFQLIIQNPLQEMKTDEDMMLADNNIICPRCIMKLKRGQESQEVETIGNTVCQHCMLRAQIYKLKAEKRKSRLRSQQTKRTTKEERFEIIFMCKKNHMALTESKPSCEDQDAVIKTTLMGTEVEFPVKLQKYKYLPTELNLLRANSMPTDLTKTQNMFQYETSFLTNKEDNKQMKPTDVEKNIGFNKFIVEAKVSKAGFPSCCTVSNLRELQRKMQPNYSRSQVTYICKPYQAVPKKPGTDDQLTASASQEIMSYRFPTVPKKYTLDKRVMSSELIRRTREELFDKEQEKKQKEIERKLEKDKRNKEHFNTMKQDEEEEVKKDELRDPLKDKLKNKLEIDKLSTKKQKVSVKDNQEKRQNLLESKQKKDKEELENKQKKEEEIAAKKRREEIDALKRQKVEEDRLKKEQHKISNKKDEAERAKKEKEAKQTNEEEKGIKKKKEDKEGVKNDDRKKKKEEELEKKQRDDEKPSREKRPLQTESELIIFKLIKEHKVKRTEERMLLEEQNIVADRQKLTEMAKKKQEADKKQQEEENAGKMRQIEKEINKRILANKQIASEPGYNKDKGKEVRKNKSKITEIIIGDNICQSKLPLPPDSLLQDVQEPMTPLLFKKKTILSDPVDAFLDGKAKHIEEKHKDALTRDIKASAKNKNNATVTPELRESTDGVFRYALSDRSFIDKGWTVLPVEEVVRKMNVYRMRPAQPEFDWFERNRNKRFMEYDTSEKLAVFDDQGGCRWYYKNGRLALDYYNSEELNSQHRYVVYSNGEPDERGRSRPYTVLATFSHLGTGVVFDHGGKIRLKYNQTEGVLLDREIGPVTTWKWHSLNDPPVLRQVMINSKLSHKDQTILQLGEKDDHNIRKQDDMMIAIEHENSIKEMRQKQSLNFKPFQIKTKVLKINENFSLKVLDQATIYLIFRECSVNIKLNIGMLLDHHEIIDTDTAALGVVSNCVERFPAATDSIAALQRSVEHAKRFERSRTERGRILRPPPPGDSAERLVSGLSRPLKVPLRKLSTSQTITKINVGHCKCSRKPSCNLYYNSRLP